MWYSCVVKKRFGNVKVGTVMYAKKDVTRVKIIGHGYPANIVEQEWAKEHLALGQRVGVEVNEQLEKEVMPALD